MLLTLAITQPIIKKIAAARRNDAPLSPVKFFAGVAVLLVIGLGSATFIASYIYADLQLNASFEQRLQVLAPHVTEKEVKELRASWALMTTKAHYLSIKSKMELLASQANIQLPAVLLRDWWPSRRSLTRLRHTSPQPALSISMIDHWDHENISFRAVAKSPFGITT